LLSRRAIGLPAKPLLDNTGDMASRISFSQGFPDPGSLPTVAVAEATAAAMAKDGRWAL
jgi:hypothetical protein